MITLQGQHVRIIRKDETLTVFRDMSATYKHGRLEKNDTIEFKIKCNVQPLSARELLMVPEGDRFKEQYNIWIENPIELESIVIDNDRIVRGNSKFQLQDTENWGKYIKGRMMRIDIGPERNDVP